MLQIINNNEIVTEVKSVSAAWNKFRDLRDNGAQGSLDAVDLESKEIMLAVILKTNSKGKVEFRNRDTEENKKITKKKSEKTAIDEASIATVNAVLAAEEQRPSNDTDTNLVAETA